MDNDPVKIHISRVEAAYRALGLAPEGWENTFRIELGANGITIERWRQKGNGPQLLLSDGTPPRETTEIPVTRSATVAEAFRPQEFIDSYLNAARSPDGEG